MFMWVQVHVCVSGCKQRSEDNLGCYSSGSLFILFFDSLSLAWDDQGAQDPHISAT